MKEKRNLLTGIGLISAFALWNVLIQCVDKYISLICSTLDILPVLLLFMPVFGKGRNLS